MRARFILASLGFLDAQEPGKHGSKHFLCAIFTGRAANLTPSLHSVCYNGQEPLWRAALGSCYLEPAEAARVPSLAVYLPNTPGAR